jgi:uncharacterized protein YfaS (alpha-2-macroglobulin family)
MKHGWILSLALAFATAASAADAPPTEPASREKALKLQKDGNFKDAYDLFRALALEPRTEQGQAATDLRKAVECLQRLNRLNEEDALLEDAIKAHAGQWRLLAGAADLYLEGNHYGFIIAGNFERGHHRGGGRYVNAFERDRVRALQLYRDAIAKSAGDKDAAAVADVYLRFAQALQFSRGYYEAWRLQYLTDLAALPDYDEGYAYYSGESRGAPVDENNAPVLYRIPKGWDEAANDGERWRWLLIQAMELAPNRTNEILKRWADFLHQQFGVQTCAGHAGIWGQQDPDKTGKGPQTYALHTLGEDETLAKLASGIRRFKLADEFNPIRIYRRIADNPQTGQGEAAVGALAQLFEDRRQYPTAAECWRRSIKEYGPGHQDWKLKRLDQIVGSWGQFEPATAQPAGRGAVFEFRFRNAASVAFEARAVDVKKLLADVKAYIKSAPRNLDWDRMNIADIGYRLVQGKGDEYLGKPVANWELPLQPRPQHFDKRVTVTTPLQRPGAYWVTAKVKDGNTCSALVWVEDSVLVKKPLDEGVLCFVADAVTGKPVAKANVEFFGYRQDWENNGYKITTTDFAEFADAAGVLTLKKPKVPENHNWLIIATTEDGRFAYLGFTGVWHGRWYDQEYNQTKVYLITDRPVYRPQQKVQFKFWVRHAKYDQEDTSSFGGQKFTVQLNDPQGQKVMEKTFVADEYGGFDGTWDLPKDAALGQYWLNVVNHGGGTFRVEEYKKPEFEVSVEAPTEPVMLGDTITATVKAKYYFGAPVTKGKMKIKVTRSDETVQWYPPMAWDWLYGSGYWWFGYDYAWYRGWGEWGCPRPWWPWVWWGSRAPPEIVAETEQALGPDGTAKVTMDSAIAKELYSDRDHRYSITAEVTDESRRTIVGSGSVLAARRPFRVYTWLDRGFYRVGDQVVAQFSARTPDGKPVEGKGTVKLLKLAYDKDGEPVEKEAGSWDLQTNPEGFAQLPIRAREAGQFRLACRVADSKGHVQEGAFIFVIRGEGFNGADFRFNNVELVADKREYAPGEKVKLMLNTERRDGTVLLFVRPANGVYLPPKVVTMDGKSVVEEIEVTKKDMPNFFVEALTIADGRVFVDTREIVVPPEKRVLNVEVLPSAERYLPGAKATVKVRLTDFFGKPFLGSLALAIYDKSVEYISGGSNVPEIRKFFWEWRRHHQPQTEHSLNRPTHNLVRPNTPAMAMIGAFGHLADEELTDMGGGGGGFGGARAKGLMMNRGRELQSLGDVRRSAMANGFAPPAPMAASTTMEQAAAQDAVGSYRKAGAADKSAVLRDEREAGGGEVEAVVRSEFADTAFWAAAVKTDSNGVAEVALTMPQNLTGWKIRTWGMGHGTKVGEGAAEVVTAKNLILRLQAPRFFVEKDEVVLSANVHNYLAKAKNVRAVLEVEGGFLEILDKPSQSAEIAATGERRFDWRVKVLKEGQAVVRMKALTDEESDAMQMTFPVYVHGMLKTESWSGVLPDGKESGKIVATVPQERRPDATRLEVRYSPTLAGALVDALPYLVAYPYGCTEQTLNRFLPAAITQKILIQLGVDLKAVKEKRTNLNAQELGDAADRAAQWKRFQENPVFDQETLADVVKEGLKKLTAMQLSDGGWGWFSGWGERSSPHLTATVVHGLQVARDNDVALVPGTLENGVQWLKRYQAEQVRLIQNAPAKKHPWKSRADDLDALVYMVLVDAKADNAEMREFLYRDRVDLSVYAKAMFGLALHKTGQAEKLTMILQNIEQFLVQDDENQTAYLKLGNDGYWWYWYGSEYEAHATYLKLLALTDPKGPKASRLVKYLLNNRKHATYWNSTRDTALCLEAMADYLKASGEAKPDLTLEIWVDGKKQKDVRITADNLFAFDNQLLLQGDALAAGQHTIEFRKKGAGPLYFNAYLTNFTLEDKITRAGLEVKVNRKVYKLNRADKSVYGRGDRGQAVAQKVEKYVREELPDGARLKSGDLVEIELTVESKNDYEYIIVEDMKAAGFEPVEVRSGYNGNDLNAFVEFRDERVAFFCRQLARGNHSVSYRLRAEIPGKFSALPAKIHAMYAPELVGNSDEIKLRIED